MTHSEFVSAYQAGAVNVEVDRQAAARLLSGRMLLPFILLPVLGFAVALALTGAWIWGAIVFIAAMALRFAVRASAQGFVLSRSLGDPRFYDEMVKAGVVSISASPAK
jgi:hypothetical protein